MLVGYNSISAAQHSLRMAGVAATLSGYNSALPDAYRPQAEELATLLNAALERTARTAGAGMTEYLEKPVARL